MFETIRTWHCEDCDTQLQAEDSECPQCKLRAEVKRLQRENERLEARVDELTVSLLDPPHYLRSKVAQLEAEKAELESRVQQATRYATGQACRILTDE